MTKRIRLSIQLSVTYNSDYRGIDGAEAEKVVKAINKAGKSVASELSGGVYSLGWINTNELAF